MVELLLEAICVKGIEINECLYYPTVILKTCCISIVKSINIIAFRHHVFWYYVSSQLT